MAATADKKVLPLLKQPEEVQQDVQSISDLIDQLKKQYKIDEARIYANGLSNGGGMSFLLGCRLSTRIAAIGGVGGAYILPWTEYKPQRPVPAIIFHGTADPIVPFHASPSGGFNALPDIPLWVNTLAEHNGCRTNTVSLPESGSVSGVWYQAGTNNADVVFYTVVSVSTIIEGQVQSVIDGVGANRGLEAGQD